MGDDERGEAPSGRQEPNPRQGSALTRDPAKAILDVGLVGNSNCRRWVKLLDAEQKTSFLPLYA